MMPLSYDEVAGMLNEIQGSRNQVEIKVTGSTVDGHEKAKEVFKDPWKAILWIWKLDREVCCFQLTIR